MRRTWLELSRAWCRSRAMAWAPRGFGNRRSRPSRAHPDEGRCRFPDRRRAAQAQSRSRGSSPLQVLVRDNNVDQALRVLKKKMQREGIFREMKQRKAYEKPSERRVRENSEAIRRARKLARKKLQREGLLADPRKKKVLDAKGRDQ